MADIPVVRNPLGWSQLVLLGGWNRVWGFTALYAGAVLTISVIIYRATGVSMSPFAQGAIGILFMSQAVLFFLISCSQIKKCILRDFTSDMITSHRLSAMSGHTAVLGYMSGPLAQIFAISVVNWVAVNIFTLLVGPGQGIRMAGPTLLFAVFLCLAVTCWSLAVLMGLATRGKMNVTGLIVVIGLGSNITMISILPGLAIMIPVVRFSQFSSAATTGIDAAEVFVAMLLQSSLTVTFFLAAARKFHRDDVQAFTPVLANTLLAICTLSSALAIRFWRPDESDVMGGFEFAVEPSNQAIMTLIGLALVCCLPIAVAADSEARWARRQATDRRFPTRRPRPYYESVLVGIIIVFGVMAAVVGRELGLFLGVDGKIIDARTLVTIPVSFLLALLTLAGLLRFCYGIGAKAIVMGVFAIVVMWLAPLLAEVGWAVLNDRHPSEGESLLFTLSPIGLWTAVLKKYDAPVLGGLAAQAALAFVLLVLAQRVRKNSSAALEPALHP